VRYHTRRALANAYFDASIRDAVSEDAAKETYREKFKPQQQVHARHILVATEAEVKDVAERLKKGEDFTALATEKSKDSTKGGDLGFIARGQTVKPFEDAASDLTWAKYPSRCNRSSAGTSSRSRRNAISPRPL